MPDIVFGQETLLDALDALGAAYSTLTFRLYEAGGPPIVPMDDSTFTEATFPGYAGIPMVSGPGPAFFGPLFVAQCFYSAYTWTASGSALGKIVLGWYATRPDPMGGPRQVVLAQAFPAPIDMSTAGNVVAVLPGLAIENIG